MRPILILSVAMLMVVSLTDARSSQESSGSQTKNANDEAQKEEKSTQTEDGKESDGDKYECGKPKGDNTVLRWVDTVDAKTAKTIKNVLKRGKGKATGGKANKIDNVRIIIEAKVDQNNVDDLLDDLVKEQRTRDAKASSSDAKGGQSSNEDEGDTQDDNDGTRSDDDKEAEQNSLSTKSNAEKASAGSGDK